MTQTEFAELVRRMRAAQKNYFRTQAAARNTGNGELFKEAKEYLVESKNLEKQVDEILEPGNDNQETVSGIKWIDLKNVYTCVRADIDALFSDPLYILIRLAFTLILSAFLFSPGWIIIALINSGNINPNSWSSLIQDVWIWSFSLVAAVSWLISGSSFQISWGDDPEEEEDNS